MICCGCSFFNKEQYTKFKGNCKEIDRYVSLQLFRCPFEKKLRFKDKVMLKLMKLFHVDKKLELDY